MPKKNGSPYNSERSCADCDRIVYARGLCKTHYHRERYRLVNVVRVPRVKDSSECAVDGCDRQTERFDGICPKHSQRMRNWGLSLSELNGYLSVEVCDSCGQGPQAGRSLHIDHNHAHCPRGCRDCIRGVLCHACNVSLGLLQEDPARIEALAAYARRVS